MEQVKSCSGAGSAGYSLQQPGLIAPPPRLSELAERLARTVGLARALVQGGRHLDLTGIDDGVGVLCAQTLDLPPDQARSMLPLLWGVREQVSSLTAALHTCAAPSGSRPC